MSRKKWTAKEVKRVKYLSAIGRNDEEIAKILDRTTSSVMSFRRSERISTTLHPMGILERALFKIQTLFNPL